MRINGSIFDPLRPDRANPVGRPPGSRPSDPVAPTTGTSPVRSDSVSISDAGRSLAARAQQTTNTTFDPERVAELRTKVLTGAYNTLDVVDQVARRIISRGDL